MIVYVVWPCGLIKVVCINIAYIQNKFMNQSRVNKLQQLHTAVANQSDTFKLQLQNVAVADLIRGKRVRSETTVV